MTRNKRDCIIGACKNPVTGSLVVLQLNKEDGRMRKLTYLLGVFTLVILMWLVGLFGSPLAFACHGVAAQSYAPAMSYSYSYQQSYCAPQAAIVAYPIQLQLAIPTVAVQTQAVVPAQAPAPQPVPERIPAPQPQAQVVPVPQAQVVEQVQAPVVVRQLQQVYAAPAAVSYAMAAPVVVQQRAVSYNPYAAANVVVQRNVALKQRAVVPAQKVVVRQKAGASRGLFSRLRERRAERVGGGRSVQQQVIIR